LLRLSQLELELLILGKQGFSLCFCILDLLLRFSMGDALVNIGHYPLVVKEIVFCLCRGLVPRFWLMRIILYVFLQVTVRLEIDDVLLGVH
jgi:hypothetical protein